MNFHGAKFEEIVGVINYIAREATDPASWQIVSGQLVAQGLVSGVNLRLRHVYNDNGLSHLSLTGKGWSVSFIVNKQLPRLMPDDEWSEKTEITLAPIGAISMLSKEYSKLLVRLRINFVDEPFVFQYCLHKPHIISPEEFRTEMTILRMFSSEWEQ